MELGSVWGRSRIGFRTGLLPVIPLVMPHASGCQGLQPSPHPLALRMDTEAAVLRVLPNLQDPSASCSHRRRAPVRASLLLSLPVSEDGADRDAPPQQGGGGARGPDSSDPHRPRPAEGLTQQPARACGRGWPRELGSLLV